MPFIIMLNKIFFTGVVILLLTSVSYAQGVPRTCHDIKDFKSDVAVLFSSPKLVEVSFYSLKELKAHYKSDFYRWKQPYEDHFWILNSPEDIGGYYRVSMGVDSQYQFKVKPMGDPKYQLFCIFFEKLKVVLDYEALVFYDKSYILDACQSMRLDFLKHMETRTNLGKGDFFQKQADIKKVLSSSMKEMEAKPVSKENVKKKIARMKKAIVSMEDRVSDDLYKKLVKVNEEFSVPDSVPKSWSDCGYVLNLRNSIR